MPKLTCGRRRHAFYPQKPLICRPCQSWLITGYLVGWKDTACPFDILTFYTEYLAKLLSKSRCRVCQFLWQMVLDREPDPASMVDKVEVTRAFRYQELNTPVTIGKYLRGVPEAEWGDRQRKILEVTLCFSLVNFLGSPKNYEEAVKIRYDRRRRVMFTGIKKAFQRRFDRMLPRRWLTECVCNNGHTGRGLPPNFRLIDAHQQCVINAFDKHNQSDPVIRYVALSYVWELCTTSAPLSLRHDTYHNFYQPGGLSQQPIRHLLHEAIRFCRLLDIRYLWVDRFCIVQDNDEDKEEQIRCMGKVYSLATVTLVAAFESRKTDCIPGFLSDRVRRPRARVNSIWLGYEEETGRMMYENIYNDYVQVTAPLDKTVWGSRGWTYQERLLSPRRLYIFDNRMLYECCCGFAIEDLPWITPAKRNDPHLSDDPFLSPSGFFRKYVDSRPQFPVAISCTKPLTSKLHFSLVPIQGRSRCNWVSKHTENFITDMTLSMSQYKAIIMLYSHRSLSFASDRWPAVSGILSELALPRDDDVTSSPFFHGLWKEEFATCLLWRRIFTKPNQDTFKSKFQAIVPDESRDGKRSNFSWSWVSVSFPVSHYYTNTLVGQTVVMISSFYLPQIKYGDLMIMSALGPAGVDAHRKFSSGIFLRGIDLGDNAGVCWMVFSRINRFPDYADILMKSMVFIVRMVKYVYRGSLHVAFYALLLEPVCGAEGLVYRRGGMASGSYRVKQETVVDPEVCRYRTVFVV